MKARIHITLKAAVLDPQGSAIGNALRGLGFPEIRDVRQGKYLEIDLASTDRELATERLRSMCEKLLANTVIENYRIELI